MPGEPAWEAALELIGLGFSISYANYLALLQASTIVLAGSNWIDHEKTKIGYEIPLNRHFYRYEPPRPLEEIEADIKKLEGQIVEMLGGVTV